MAWTFRRRVKVGGVNLNLSRSGLGVSAGAGPFRVGVDAKGRHYTTVRGPFGLYNRQYHTPSASATPEPQPQQFVAAAAKSSAYLLILTTLFVVFAMQDSQPLWLFRRIAHRHAGVSDVDRLFQQRGVGQRLVSRSRGSCENGGMDHSRPYRRRKFPSL